MPNPFAFSRWYARLSKIFVSPLFRIWPMPRGFVLLTATGRRSGQPRRQPVRAVRQGESVYLVSVHGARADRLRNARANPQVSIKLGAHNYQGRAREPAEPSEREQAIAVYTGVVTPFDYFDYASLYWGFPTRRNIQEAHRRWLSAGIMVAIDIQSPGGGPRPR